MEAGPLVRRLRQEMRMALTRVVAVGNGLKKD